MLPEPHQIPDCARKQLARPAGQCKDKSKRAEIAENEGARFATIVSEWCGQVRSTQIRLI